jgi:hypothetical protein
MTITTPFQDDPRKDEQVDRRVDVQTDGCKAAGKDSGGLRSGSAFVIVLANHKGGVTRRPRRRTSARRSPRPAGGC